jgi:hypothetical protein
MVRTTQHDEDDATATVRVRPDGTLRLGIVADTHSEPHAEGLKHLQALAPDAILHAGDIGAMGVLEALSAIAPTFSVRGNIDGRGSPLPEALAVQLVDGDRVVLTMLLTHIALAGPRLRPDAARLAQRRHASLVVCGHSHVPFIGQERGLTVFNPGSIGPKRFHLPIVFGVLELDRAQVRLKHVDCVTGKAWTP